MPRNASGIYTLPGGNPVTPGDVIEADWANTTLEDVADALTNSLSRTGAGGMLAPFRIADGNISAPGLSYLNETNTGLYRSGSGSTWMAVLGVNVAQFSTVGLTIASAKALTALGNASVGGTFAVTGATTLASTLAVTGALTATGGVLGNITAGSGTSTFNNVVINGNLDMDAGSSGTITNLPNPTNPGDAANKAYVDSQDALRLALTGGTMTGVIAMSNNKVTGVATPTADQDAANKAYVDSVAQGIDAKASCKAATTANITLSGTQTIDGVAIVAGERVLVKNQSSAADNGIYVAAVSTWSRAADANTWDELVAAFTFIESGTENGNNGYICTIAPGGTLGVTAVTWAQFSGAGQVIAGQGLSKTGNTIQVNTASSSRIVIGADDIDLATTGVVADTYKSVSVDAYGRVTAGTNPTTLAGFGIGDAYTQTQTNTLLAAKLSLAGGTMSGAIAMGGSKITGMADPTLAQDAATKNYIDTIFGSTSSAAASAAAAATSATNAASSASAASTSATNAASSATSAASSATAAAASYDSFDDRYLGAKASDPTVDNDGNPLLTGALYWNTTVSEMRVYNGSAWVAAYLPAAGYMDLTSNQTAAGVKTFSSNPILSSGTANGVVYLNGSKALTSGSGLQFDGTNLGLGVTPSAWQSSLKVFEFGRLGTSITGNSSNGNLSVIGNAYYNASSAFIYSNDGYALRYTQSPASGAHTWFTSASGLTGNTVTYVQAMTLDASGRLGLGVTSPSSLIYAGASSGKNTVTINGGTTNSGDGAELIIANGGTTYGGIGNYSGVFGGAYDNTMAVHGYWGLRFFTTGTERARIDSSGNFLIGTASSTGAKLTVVGDQHIRTGYGLAFYDSTNANYWAQYNSSGNFIFTNGTERARMTSTGGFAVGTTTDPGAGLISDAAGNVRSIPPVGTKTGSYTLAKADVGKYVQVGSGGSITIPTSVFAEGDVVSLMNNTTGNVTITCSAPTAYKGGTNSVVTSLTLQTRGIATVFFISSSVCIVTGNLA